MNVVLSAPICSAMLRKPNLPQTHATHNILHTGELIFIVIMYVFYLI